MSSHCNLYASNAVGFERDAVDNMDCQGHPSEPDTSTIRWFRAQKFQHAANTNCNDLKNEDPFR